MLASDKTEFTKFVKGQCEMRGQDISKDGLNAWWDTFFDQELYDFKQAFRQASLRGKYASIKPNEVFAQLQIKGQRSDAHITDEFIEEQIKQAIEKVNLLLPEELKNESYGLMRFENSLHGTLFVFLKRGRQDIAMNAIRKFSDFAKDAKAEGLSAWPNDWMKKLRNSKEPQYESAPAAPTNPVKSIHSVAATAGWGHSRH